MPAGLNWGGARQERGRTDRILLFFSRLSVLGEYDMGRAFLEKVLNQEAKRAGDESLIAKILSPGTPHPFSVIPARAGIPKLSRQSFP